MTYDRLTWLLPVLRDGGLDVGVVSGWESRGRPASTGHSGPYHAVGFHHTGTRALGAHPTLGLVVRGRSDLPGPLCHDLLSRTGKVWLVAAGRANHAGLSNGSGRLNTGDGNRQIIGTEVESSGYEKLTAAQLEVIPVLAALKLRHIGEPASSTFLHHTWSTTGKWDLGEQGHTIDLAALRHRVAKALDDLKPPKDRATTLPTVDLSRLTRAARTESRHRRTPTTTPLYPAGVKLVEAELVNAGLLDKAYAGDGYYGPPTLRAYHQWQTRLGYRGDDATGIPGMTSLVKLGARGKDSFRVKA